MKIGISAIHVRPGKSGSHEPYLVNLVNALLSLDSPHEFTIFVTPANYPLFHNTHAGMEFVSFPKAAEGPLTRILVEQLWLPINARRKNIDVLHYPGSSSSFLARRNDVVTVHQDPISHGASIDVAHTYGPPLFAAAEKGHWRFVSWLIKQGADAELAARHADSHNATDLAELIRAEV